MSVYIIYENGVEYNRILADEAFAAEYCAANGYTYEMEPEPEPVQEPDPSYTPVTWSALAASIKEGVNEV